MTLAANLSSICTGHGCFPPRRVVTGSSDVFTEGSGSIRIGDHWEVHCCPNKGCHNGSSVAGSSTVFVNGNPKVRIGDHIDCGSSVMTGCSTVFVG